MTRQVLCRHSQAAGQGRRMQTANPEESDFPCNKSLVCFRPDLQKSRHNSRGCKRDRSPTFQAFSADLAHEPGQPIYFFTGLGPKSESRAIWLMTSVLREAEERIRLVSA